MGGSFGCSAFRCTARNVRITFRSVSHSFSLEKDSWKSQLGFAAFVFAVENEE